MTIIIDKKKCDGCGLSKQPPCMKSCPGDLIYKDFASKKGVLRSDADCWDCYCCAKVCPREAIDIVLSYEISNRGALLQPKIIDSNTIEWVLKDQTGKISSFRHSTKLLSLEEDVADKKFTELGEGI